MEMQWKSMPCNYLRSALREVQNQEQTLELRLTEGMPDIGRVLWAWGQPQLREKQWRTEDMSISGGISAWVLYVPEDGSQPRCVEGWIPFQAKWKLPPQCREGMILGDVRLRSMDARALSSRKILVRASIGLLGEALEPQQAQISPPEQQPEGVFLLQNTYPAQLVKEAGEKLFSVDDSLDLDRQGKVLCCRVHCRLTEQAVPGGRVVLRGMLGMQYLMAGEDGHLHSGTQEIPFAQFGELEHEYDKEATAAISMAFAGVEWGQEGDKLHIKCDLIAQYVVCDRCMLQITEDAYSPQRAVTPNVTQLEMPVVLDRVHQDLNAELDVPVEARDVVDVAFLPDHPVYYREDGNLMVEIPGAFQTLYYDQEGNLQTSVQDWAGHWQLPADEGCSFSMAAEQMSQPTGLLLGDRMRLEANLGLDVQTGAVQSIPMVTGITVGEMTTADPRRPSVILRRCEGMSLWELAKTCGSTVEAIERANGVTGTAEPGQMLLIPVL